MNNSFETFIGEGGRQYLVHEDFLYILDYNEDGLKQWLCSNKSCKGALYINEENYILKRVHHAHSPVSDIIPVNKAPSFAKERCSTTNGNPIIKQQPNVLNSEGIGKMISADYFKDAIYEKINLNDGYIPSGIMDIPEVLQVDIKGNRFLRYDSSMEENERFIIFFSEFKRSFIPKINTFIIDGTLKSTPQGFDQLVVLHGYLFGRTFPFIYILLKDKSEISYLRAFSKCMELVNMNVKNIVTDYETELIKALKKSFPEAEFNGCLTNLNQIAYKTVKTMGQINSLKKNRNYNLAFRKILKLVFVPSQDMLTFYEDIKKFINNNSIRKIKKFLRYFKRKILNIDVKKANEKKVNLGMNFWCAFNRVEKDIPITTNSAKFWNRTINLKMGTLNPTISVFISKILDTEEEDIYNLKRSKKCIFGTDKSYRLKTILRQIITNYKFYPRDNYINILLKQVNFRYG